MDSGLSLLLLRPHVLLSSLHHLVILLALRLQGAEVPKEAARTLAAYGTTSRPSRSISRAAEAMAELADELRINQEVMDKVRGLEFKLEYQIKKLSGLAEAAETREKAIIEDAEEGVSIHLLLVLVLIQQILCPSSRMQPPCWPIRAGLGPLHALGSMARSPPTRFIGLERALLYPTMSLDRQD